MTDSERVIEFLKLDKTYKIKEEQKMAENKNENMNLFYILKINLKTFLFL